MDTEQAKKFDYFQIILRVIISGIFIYAAIPKIINPQAFYLDILGYNIVDGELAKTIALWLPWVEIIAALGVMAGIWLIVNLRLIQVMLSMFVILLILTLIRGIDADCGCFGTASGQVTWWHVFGDTVLLFITTFLITWARFERQQRPAGGRLETG